MPTDDTADARKVAEEIAESYWGGNPKAGDQVACTIGRESITVRQSLAHRIERGLVAFAVRVRSEAREQEEQDRADFTAAVMEEAQQDYTRAKAIAEAAEAKLQEAEAERDEAVARWDSERGERIAKDARVGELEKALREISDADPDAPEVESWKWLARKFKAAAKAALARPEAPTPPHISMPEPKGGHDMRQGPCACGAWHQTEAPTPEVKP